MVQPWEQVEVGREVGVAPQVVGGAMGGVGLEVGVVPLAQPLVLQLSYKI